ncbi:efflux RND transporter periplasmic adaptor subunit [Neptunomonas japonica]|uniref:efflux RND transporter periplasmic adaptor subunit n=1 Tax=Neptunomonas japonica TaxID=417574 RepID=UPI000423E520|nr:efflux RND transporter periplasmic adaptor subunit [Neptunomonas japonica]
MFNHKKKWLITTLLLISTAPMLATAAEKPGGLPAEVVKIQPETLRHELNAVGTLEAWESVVIRPEQNGLITKILFKESHAVKQGDTLFELNADSYRAEVSQAKARVSLSLNEFKRAEKLLKKRVGSVNDRDTTLAQLRVDEAQLEVARTLLKKMTIKTPFNGVIGLRNVSPGDYVTSGQDLVQLTDISKMKVEFSLPETTLSQIKTGQTVSLNVAAYPQAKFSGEIYAISPVADVRSHNIKIKAIVNNESGQLRPGLFSKISVLLSADNNALLVPEEAIIPNNGAFLVMRMDKNNSVAMVPVTLGLRQGDQVQILNGLNADDVIVTAGHLKLRPGMPITPIFPQPKNTPKQEG